jgi:hypothetical protein
LIERNFSKKPLHQCRCDFSKEKIILLLDNSGSCQDFAGFFGQIAQLARKFRDIEVFWAPNALPEGEGEEAEEWKFFQRNIIFFGDFDGIERIINSSFKNKIVWFSCERRFHHHPLLDDFQGIFIVCMDEYDLYSALRKIVSGKIKF